MSQVQGPPPGGGELPQQRMDLGAAEARARRNRTIKWVFALVLLGILVAFGIQNYNQPATVRWVFFENRSRVFWVMVVSGVLGWLIGYLMGRPSRIERRIIKEQAGRYKPED